MSNPSTHVPKRRGLPPGTHGLAREVVRASQRERLLASVIEAVAEEGYAAARLADIVKRANVSRRTFYEHFTDKEECFLAAYDAGSEALFERVINAHAQTGDWPQRARAAVRAYLTAFAEQPAYAQATMVEILGAGSRALAHRRRMNRRYAELIKDLHREARQESPDIPQVPPPVFTATVAAVDGLVCDYIEQGRTLELPGLEDVVVYVELALLAGHDVAARTVPG